MGRKGGPRRAGCWPVPQSLPCPLARGRGERTLRDTPAQALWSPGGAEGERTRIPRSHGAPAGELPRQRGERAWENVLAAAEAGPAGGRAGGRAGRPEGAGRADGTWAEGGAGPSP